MKKFTMFLSAMMLAFLLVASPVMADVVQGPAGFYKHKHGQVQYFENGHPVNQSEWTLVKELSGCCTPDVTAVAQPSSVIAGAVVTAPGSTPWAGGEATAYATLSGTALATGMDTEEWKWSWRPWGWNLVFVKGEAEADGETELTMSSAVKIFTNGPKYNTGLSYTFVSATSTLDIEGSVWAKGTDGCPQSASLDLEGTLSAIAWGNSFSEHPTNGAFASAGGWGMTTVSFEGHEEDFSTHGGWFCSPNKAEVEFDSSINVNQKLFTTSWVSPKGDTSINFAKVWGGSAKSDLGGGGWFGWGEKDNIQLTGITARGGVSQSGAATNGMGALAYGSSSANFSGATGYVGTLPGYWCSPSPGQYANVGGYAVVYGYNNVSTSPSGALTVTSHQYGYATTGNSGRISVISNGQDYN
jgi:hypothetical protein